MMQFNKKTLLLAGLFTGALLTGCQSQSNVLNFSTPSPTATFNTQNQSASISVMTQDLRPSREVASYTKGGEITRLTAVPEVGAMFQQAVQQDLNAKGFQIVQSGKRSL